MRIALLMLLTCAWANAQAPETNPTQGPPVIPWQQVNFYSGTNIAYTCYARSVETSVRPGIVVAISAASNANPVSLTSTAHGFDPGSRPKVTIAGGTGSWAGINGTFTATITGTSTFTIPVDSTAFGALAGTVTFITTAPRYGVAEWAVKKYVTDTSGNITGSYWLGGSTSLSAKCSDGSLATANQQ